MLDDGVLSGWPEHSALLAVRGQHQLRDGNLTQPRAWASVSKVAVAYGICRMVGEGVLDLDEIVEGDVTLADLLAHAGGFGYEASDLRQPPRTRRVYSNVGIDMVIAHVSDDPVAWFDHWVGAPLEWRATSLAGRPSGGLVGPLNEMLSLAVAWRDRRGLAPDVADAFCRPYLPELIGVVPGFGRFDPCWWGMGVELRGSKEHWMGPCSSSSSYGHFGRSGTFLLVDPDNDLCVVAAAAVDFGPWAVSAWPATQRRVARDLGVACA